MKTLERIHVSADISLKIKSILINVFLLSLLYSLSFSIVNFSHSSYGYEIVGMKAAALSGIIFVLYNVVTMAVEKNKTIIFNIGLIASFFFLSDLIPLESMNAMFLSKIELVGILSAPFLILSNIVKKAFA